MKHWDNLDLATQNKVWDTFRRWDEVNVGMIFKADLEQFVDGLIDILVGGKEMEDGFIGAAAERQEGLDEAIEEIDRAFKNLEKAGEDEPSYEANMLAEKIENLQKGNWL